MPRAIRVKAARRHAPAVQLPSKRTFAVPDEQVAEAMLPGSAVKPSETDNEPATSRMRKADRPPASALVPPVPSHPYSRSHARREKRKTRQELSGGHLRAVAAALSEAIGETDALPLRSLTRVEREEEKRKREEVRRDGAKIGMGKGRTLGEKARRKQIGLEAKRIPAIMHHPEYKKDPWATIRLHASNSIAAKGGLAISGEKREGRKQVVMDGAEVIDD